MKAAEDVPPFDRSAYDGYAFRAEDVRGADREHPVTLSVIEEVPAGSVPHCEITRGTAAKILTGRQSRREQTLLSCLKKPFSQRIRYSCLHRRSRERILSGQEKMSGKVRCLLRPEPSLTRDLPALWRPRQKQCR